MGHGAESDPRRVRCILWHAPRANVPEALLTALDRRGVGFVARSNPFGACAEACALARDKSPHEKVVLLLVEPGTLPRVAEVADTLHEYAPDVVLWSFEAAATPQLRAYVASEPRIPEPTPPSPLPPPQVQIPNGLRERLGQISPRPNATPAPEVEPLGRSLLSQEELAMLLSDEPREDSR